MEANFKYKMDSGEDMPVEQVKDIFTDEWTPTEVWTW
jgi:hypothetical protein